MLAVAPLIMMVCELSNRVITHLGVGGALFEDFRLLVFEIAVFVSKWVVLPLPSLVHLSAPCCCRLNQKIAIGPLLERTTSGREQLAKRDHEFLVFDRHQVLASELASDLQERSSRHARASGFRPSPMNI